MLRILIFLALGYLAYRIVKSLLVPRRDEGVGQVPKGNLPRRVDDELVQDPVCKTYVPLREAEVRRINGRDYYFCSRACAERFLEEGAGGREDNGSGTKDKE